MEIQINQEVIDTVCNSLRASKYSLMRQLSNADRRKTEIINSQLRDVDEALEVFQYLES